MLRELRKRMICTVMAVLMLGTVVAPVSVYAAEPENTLASETEPDGLQISELESADGQSSEVDAGIVQGQAQDSGQPVNEISQNVEEEEKETEENPVDPALEPEPVDTTGWEGFHQAPDSEDWYYYTDGEPDTGLTSVVKGTVNEENALWYVKQGKVQFDVESVEKNESGWWYIKNGKVDFSYTGFAENKNGWWRIEDGKVNFNCKDILKGKVNGTTAWWYVKGGKVQLGVNTVEKNSRGWWYVKNGQVDFSYTGFAKNNNGWWRIKEGRVDFNCRDVLKGKVNGTTAWWYVKGGKVQIGVNSVEKNKNGWWRIEDGKVNFNSNTVAKNENGWWYIKKGKVDFSYTGTYVNSKGVWNVKKGKATLQSSSSMDSKAQKYSSNTKWLMIVDTKKNQLGIYYGSKGNWYRKYLWSCTTGKSSTPTVKGQFTVGSKGKSFGDTFTCWYYTQFCGNYLFHSVIYRKGSMTTITDGRLGINASHGCVRLSMDHAKWIYNNIPRGTKVVVY